MELSSKVKGLKFMRRKEDAKERAVIEASRHTSTPTIVPTRPSSSQHNSVTTIPNDKDEDEMTTNSNKHIADPTNPTSGKKDQVMMHGTKAVFQVQYEPSLTSLLQPSVRTTRLSHKDYKAPVISEASKDGLGEEGVVDGHEMEVDEGALRGEEDKKANVRKQMHAAKSKAFRPPMKRDKKGESHGGGSSTGRSSSSRKKQ